MNKLSALALVAALGVSAAASAQAKKGEDMGAPLFIALGAGVGMTDAQGPGAAQSFTAFSLSAGSDFARWENYGLGASAFYDFTLKNGHDTQLSSWGAMVDNYFRLGKRDGIVASVGIGRFYSYHTEAGMSGANAMAYSLAYHCDFAHNMAWTATYKIATPFDGGFAHHIDSALLGIKVGF